MWFSAVLGSPFALDDVICMYLNGYLALLFYNSKFYCKMCNKLDTKCFDMAFPFLPNAVTPQFHDQAIGC